VLDGTERLEQEHTSRVPEMDKAAGEQRDAAADVAAAVGEVQSQRFRDWVGADAATLAVVFTDIANSTHAGVSAGDEAFDPIRRDHLQWYETLIERHKGRLIKTKGDGVIAAFRVAWDALSFALAAHDDPGHGLEIRAGIHVGAVRVDGEDVSANSVALCARIESYAKPGEIWTSDRVKEDVDLEKAARHAHLEWRKHRGQRLKGFPELRLLWSVDTRRPPAPETQPDRPPGMWRRVWRWFVGP